ncbi:MAG: hypothetical protein JSS97_16525 [Actinobacteria bacterium]|nr:hypothetical protein [Actinomycetota bacterium]
MQGRGTWKALIAAALTLLLGLVVVSQASSDVGSTAGRTPCIGGTEKTLEVGIVKAIGCWTETTKDGATIYTGAWADQGKQGIDLNGFIMNGPKGGALQVNEKTRQVTTVTVEGQYNDKAQLYAKDFPSAGLHELGKEIRFDFVAPEKGVLQLEDLHLGSNTTYAALAGLSPVGDVETPIKIEEGGKGSMDLSVLLAGYFTLKNKPQSVTIALPTESGKGTHLDGFEFKLAEIDTFKVVTLHEFEAKYSASKGVIGGKVAVSLPSVTEKGGLGLGFQLENGALTEVSGKVAGVHVPIGAPPAGFFTSFGGGMRFKYASGKDFDVILKANADADFGPEVPTPWGKVAPLEAAAELGLGHQGSEWFFEIHGGVKAFRIPVGEVKLAIRSAGVEFGANMGIGFPCYCNKDTEPFYIGSHVGGWIGKGKFQFEGGGRVALFGLKIFDGQILVNNRAAAACWVVLGFPGGAVYEYGAREVKTFGVRCGLDDYKEKFPSNARLAAGKSRTFALTKPEGVVEVSGAGGAPEFTMTSADGHVLTTPENGDSSIQREGFRHAFILNTTTDTTDVVIPEPEGVWTITPKPGSAPITGVKAGRRGAPEKVEADVLGRGLHRTLVWDSRDRPHTRLDFVEEMPNGQEVPVLETGAADGKRRFAVTAGDYKGRRKLRAIVVQGQGATQSSIVDHYRVAEPGLLKAPREVSGWRDLYTAHARWSGVAGARSYLVQIVMHKEGKLLASYVRHVGRSRRSIAIGNFPGGDKATAKVYAINWGGKLGRPGLATFATNPPATDLQVAARHSAATAAQRGGGVLVTTRCPEGGHCQMTVTLRDHGRTIARTYFQQTPDTFNRLWLRPRSPAGRAALRHGDRFKVTINARRVDESATDVSAIGAIE